MNQCDNVSMFADGELGSKEDDAFRDHLADCEPCQKELEAILVLMARISSVAPGAGVAVVVVDDVVGGRVTVPSVADKLATSHPAWRAFCRWYKRLPEAERLQTRASILWEAFKVGLHAKRSTANTRP